MPHRRAPGDGVAWDELTARQVELARRAGALLLLPVALDHADLFCGRLAQAVSHLAEADAVVETAGSDLSLRGAIAPAIWRGQEAESPALIERLTEIAEANGNEGALGFSPAAARASASRSAARSSCTASGCGARTAASTRASPDRAAGGRRVHQPGDRRSRRQLRTALPGSGLAAVPV